MPVNLENIRIVAEFNKIWQQENTSKDSIAVGIESFIHETFREIDKNYIVISDDGKALDPKNDYKEIKFRRNTDLEKRESEAWDLLIDWANKTDVGHAVWFSPLHEETNAYFNGYPCNKVCYYEIVYTFEYPSKKALLITTILFDTPKDHCFDMAKDKFPELANEDDPEILRNRVFELKKDSSLVDVLEMIANAGKNKKTYSQETITYFVDQIKAGQDPYKIALEMQSMGIIGEHSISCPPSGLGTLGNVNSLIVLDFRKKDTSKKGKLPTSFDEIKRCVYCPFCKQTVDAGIKDSVIYCLECGESAPLSRAA